MSRGFHTTTKTQSGSRTSKEEVDLRFYDGGHPSEGSKENRTCCRVENPGSRDSHSQLRTDTKSVLPCVNSRSWSEKIKVNVDRFKKVFKFCFIHDELIYY